MRVIEASELIAADVFTAAEQARARLTFSDVERHLAQLAGHPTRPTCPTWPTRQSRCSSTSAAPQPTEPYADDEPATAAAEDQGDEETSRPRPLRLRFKALRIR